ncbi:MAG: hypothetical protein M1820_008363 [Bogoriella megaspora]|nr:MAG: hypothetical protein M1820_008363 [Bogoriella megaspora]
MTALIIAVFCFQFFGWAYHPPAGDQTCLGYLEIQLALARRNHPSWCLARYYGGPPWPAQFNWCVVVDVDTGVEVGLELELLIALAPDWANVLSFDIDNFWAAERLIYSPSNFPAATQTLSSLICALMKRSLVRIRLWSDQYFILRLRRPCPCKKPFNNPQLPLTRAFNHSSRYREASQEKAVVQDGLADVDSQDEIAQLPRRRRLENRLERLPSPHPEAALKSAKLAALHSRLSLPPRLPLQTLARTLVDASADSDPAFNNSSLSVLGSDILGYYTSEHLLCHYPRLPMVVLFAAQSAYVGPSTLSALSYEWGVEAAAHPGGEVDPGHLQFTPIDPYAPPPEMLEPGTTTRPNDQFGYRRGVSSRVVYDDQFGDMQKTPKSSGIALNKPNALPFLPEPWTPQTLPKYPSSQKEPLRPDRQPSASSNQSPTYNPPPTRSGSNPEKARQTFIRALFGALLLHCGKPYTRTFFRSHILSRTLSSPSTPTARPHQTSLPGASTSAPQGLASLFHFTAPTRDLSRLCAREGFEAPVARLISETGRLSRHPVFVVGVYSGGDKLGEGAGASLDEAKMRAAANALRGWYLYSPMEGEVSVPSEVEGVKGKEGKRYQAPLIDCGEVVV